MPTDGRTELRLWLRLLSCTNAVEAHLRTRLRTRFGATLPRFDLMAQLDKVPDGMTLGTLSRRMMVSNGNVTGLVDRLVRDGQVERLPHPTDRRATTVRLTPAGRESFALMAREHQGWVAHAFAGLDAAAVQSMMENLARLRSSVQRAEEP